MVTRPRLPFGVATAVLALLLAALAGTPAEAITLDQLSGEQWAIAPNSILDLPPAWEASEGAGVVVAVVDSGILATHRDLAPNVWVNFAERPGNGVDDDGNGYIDDVNGIDLTSGPKDNVPDDQNGHGTHVSGIIAGARNRVGIVGVAPRAKIMAVKVLNAAGGGTTNQVAEGVNYAVANGARIVNMSLNGPTPSAPLTAAIENACAANVLVVVSAGNEGRDVDSVPSFPVSIPAPCLVGVAATAPPSGGRNLASISNFGRLTIGLAAPGEGVLSAASNGDYENRTGTSMAAPHVAGVAALMLGANPALGAADLRGRLLSSAARGSLPVNAGYLNALDAVRSAGGPSTATLGQPPRLRVVSAVVSGSRTRSLRVQFSVVGSPWSIVRYDVRAAGRRLARLTPRAAATLRASVRVRRAPQSVSVRAIRRDGRSAATATRRVTTVRSGRKGRPGGGRLATSAADHLVRIG